MSRYLSIAVVFLSALLAVLAAEQSNTAKKRQLHRASIEPERPSVWRTSIDPSRPLVQWLLIGILSGCAVFLLMFMVISNRRTNTLEPVLVEPRHSAFYALDPHQLEMKRQSTLRRAHSQPSAHVAGVQKQQPMVYAPVYTIQQTYKPMPLTQRSASQ